MNITDPIYTDENAARAHFEKLQWPNGPVCPHCGNVDQARITKLQGKSTRPGVYKCKECRKPFSVTVGTVMERSHIPLNKWLAAMHLMTASKKGVSAHQLHRMLGITYEAAWFLAHRLREAMRPNPSPATPMGGEGKTVELDETFIGRLEGQPKRQFATGTYRNTVFALVERGGSARTFHVAGTTMAELVPIIRANIARETVLMTDEGRWYIGLGNDFAAHETVNHSRKEYVRGTISTNTVESYFSVFKRGMRGIYQHCAEKHLHRYLAEFEFRYNTRVALGCDDLERAGILAAATRGKRLTYRRPNAALA